MPIPVPPASQGKQCTCQENSENYSREAGLLSLLGHPRPGSFVFSNKIKLNGILKRLICFKIANLRGLSAVFLKIPFLGGSFVSSLGACDCWNSCFISLQDFENRGSEVFEKESRTRAAFSFG